MGARTRRKPTGGSGRKEVAGEFAARREALLAWYRAGRRDLPWRRTRDPYAIWVSETMLQQTRVETVIPYYERFLARFPDVRALATADRDDVLGAWAGLGYYSRARNLHEGARAVVERFEGHVPDDPHALRSLPGVGRYTAGAIASIAFDRAAPVVDGNVTRVLARWLAIREPTSRASVQARLWETAERLAAGSSPGELNQALMELGARVCTPRAPRCEACPVAAPCAARAAGKPEAIPVRVTRGPVPQVAAAAALLVRRGRALAVRRPASGLLGGLWELPGGDLRSRERPAPGLRRLVAERTGLRVGRLESAGVVAHAFSHRRLTLHVFRGDVVGGRVRLAGFDRHRWLAAGAFESLPLGRVTQKALALALADETAPARAPRHGRPAPSA